MTSSVLALLLADARFPAGSHAHSGGVEQAVDDGMISDEAGLASFLDGRLATTGAVAAFSAAAVCHHAGSGCDLGRFWSEADAEMSARLPSPASRATSRRIGAALLRTGREVFPGPVLSSLPDHPHATVALGAVGAAAGLSPFDTAAVAAYSSVSGPASAALRLLGLDPFVVARLLASLGPAIDTVAHDAASAADGPLASWPAFGSPALDFLAEEHHWREERLFAS